MTHQPAPVGDPVKAFRGTLRRAHRAEQRVRDLTVHIAELEAQMDATKARLDRLDRLEHDQNNREPR